MRIRGECFANAALSHDLEAYAVGEAPVLVGVRAKHLESARKEVLRYWDDFNARVRPDRVD